MIKFSDSGREIVARAGFLLAYPKYQALVVRARLQRISPKTTNMAADLLAEEVRNLIDVLRVSHCQFTQTTDAKRCETVRIYFRDLFNREPRLIPAQFDVYLADFPRLEAAGCEGSVTESEIREALKLVVRNKTQGLDSLPYEKYLRQTPVFVYLLELIYNYWLKHGYIYQRFKCEQITTKNKNGGDRRGSFRLLTMLQI